MLFQNIHFIINPASGKSEAILSYIQHALCKTTINWAVTVAIKEDDCYSIASDLVGQTDLVVIYGGDGSISQVARALCGSNTPMAIIPGGTANILSKELNIPQQSQDALALIIGGEIRLMRIDMGLANGNLFVLRVNMGVMADMILEVDSQLKEKLGQVAYGISALKTAAVAKPQTYNLMIDGETFIETGVLLTVTNAGSMGIGDMALFPGISINDGFLDVILMHDTDPLSVLQVAGSTIFHHESEVLKHWRCKEIVITMEESTHYICDDSERQANNIHIKILPLALNVLVAAIKQ
ncbi:diacylglycerol/lipid kinase family protein [Mucilaginibacter psychrotolerans]|nr:YegS/Rv2252/BmrU family lipid kinase [Mucilaginibacter psychrotolerans]